jgi:signal transduction histidine kinase
MQNKTSCYTSSELIKYALKKGQSPSTLFAGIEDKREILENSLEWIDYTTMQTLTKNFESGGGNLFKAAIESLREANSNLNQKVAEQTASIRAQNAELEKANAQLRESEHMKGILTGALVHDIKNHIFSIASDVRALTKERGLSNESQGILNHAASSCSSAMSLAANMLDIGKMEEGKLVLQATPVEFGVLKVILERYAQNVFFAEKNIKVRIEPPSFVLNFTADFYLLDRVLQNLLTNAAMYTPENGEVVVSFVQPSTIRVFNTGEPIPEQYRNSLFEKYSRIDTDSSRYSKGLGLFFCKMVMTAHNGNIGLECTEKGNCFVLKF